jgi:5-methylcytosine-specific restriction enzyme A
MTKRYRSLSSIGTRVPLLKPRYKIPRTRNTVRANSRERARQRKQLIARDGPLCRSCSTDTRVVAGAHADHIVALADGGIDDVSNMQLLCRICHDHKSAAESKARAARGGEPVEQQPTPTKDYRLW